MSVDDHLSAGDEATAAGRWEEAREAYEAALVGDSRPYALLGLANLAWWSGRIDEGLDLLEQAYAALVDADFGDDAALTAMWIAAAHHKTLGNQVAYQAWLGRAELLIDESTTGTTLGWIELGRAMGGGDPSSSIEHARSALIRGLADGDLDLVTCTRAVLGAELVRAGEIDEGFRLIDDAMGTVLAGAWTQIDTIATTSCYMLTACEQVTDLDRARSWLRATERLMRLFQSPLLHADCRTHLGTMLLASGDWDGAERELTEAMTAAPHLAEFHSEAAARLASLRIRQGRLEDADQILGVISEERCSLVARAELCRERNEHSMAARFLERFLSGAEPHDPDTAPALELHVEVCVMLGAFADAQGTVERLHALDAKHSSPTVRTLSNVAGARIALAESRVKEAVDLLESALGDLQGRHLPYELARVHMLLATAMATTDPEIARSEARQAMLGFDRLGARRRTDEAAEMYRRLGGPGRPGIRRTEPLTTREQEVLDLLGLGLSNPEIAERLYISPKTASHHVSNLLAKLGLRNRAEAAAYASAERQPR